MKREHRLPSERVVSDLRRRLREGEWEPGEALPSVTELAGEYQVARATISRVVKLLADDGEVVTRERWGIFRAGYDDDHDDALPGIPL